MSDILFLSDNDVFKQDLIEQITKYLPSFNVLTEKEVTPDIVIVDENLNFVKFCAEKDLKAPVILLSSNPDIKCNNVTQIVQKPFYLSAFLDTVQAAINIYQNSEEGQLEFNQYLLNPSQKEIINLRNNDSVKLTEKEISILKYLYKNSGKIVCKNDLLQEVWEYAADATTHTVETHIYRLRQKVEKGNLSAQLILTSDGGYQLII